MVTARAAGALALLLACGCGIPAEDSAHRIAEDSVPFGLLSSAPSGGDGADTGPASLSIFLVRNDRLVRVLRRVDGRPNASLALEELAKGPTKRELNDAIGTTALDIAVVTTSPAAERNTVTVDLSERVSEVPSRVQMLTFAQIVYTLADLPNIESVAFTIDGEPVDVLRADGSLAEGAVQPGDYREFAPS